jgi:hypothetical protein
MALSRATSAGTFVRTVRARSRAGIATGPADPLLSPTELQPRSAQRGFGFACFGGGRQELKRRPMDADSSHKL